MSRERKGLQDIRTNAGRPTAPGSKHRLYIRLSTLEMERTRRQQEFEVAHARAEKARARVARLQGEIDEIITLIGGTHTQTTDARPATPAPDLVAVKHAYGVRTPRVNHSNASTTENTK